MSNNQSNRSYHGMSGGELLCVALTVLFVGLKLTNYIDWSWWWVLSPLWIPLAIVGVIIGCGVLYFGAVMAVTIIQDRWEKWRQKGRS